MAPFAFLQHRFGNFLDRHIFKLPCFAEEGDAADQQTAVRSDIIANFGKQLTISRKRQASGSMTPVSLVRDNAASIPRLPRNTEITECTDKYCFPLPLALCPY